MASQQAQAEGLCLRFPENLPPHPTFSHEAAVQMLLRAIQISAQVPYHWGYIDKPADGQLYLLYIPAHLGFPIDGIHFLEPEQRYTIQAGPTRELEVIEVRYGFIPGSGETGASRVRRRYRLHKGGHPQLVLVHYSRGASLPIPPNIINQPVRPYPLRPVNEPAVFVMGDKMGQKIMVPPGPPVPPGSAHPIAPGAPVMPFAGRPDPQVLLAQQNRDMEALERRSQRERSMSMTQRAPPPPPARQDEEDSAGDKHTPKPPPAYSIFDKSELDEKASKLTSDIQDLRARAAARQAVRTEAENADVSMEAPADITISVQAPASESLAI
ncbi:hypothetical protein EWM64_g4341 [Hericium alpestre]|uniref:SWI/SNF and RSC complexes subunit Ssr4 N-terminal domain-containing protein n=1 Tax=Hericium alpestre TaxID=135208 RepID=A0A4Y9ZYT8_9AGAM|nr:hypothetical protein EWM64_g4341 [Hericium alpestre]